MKFKKNDKNFSPTTDEKILDYLQLIRSENIGPVSFYQLIKQFGNVRSALECLGSSYKDCIPEYKKYNLISRSAVERELEYAYKHSISFITYDDISYPPLIRHADAPPPILAVRGQTNFFLQKTVSIVGSRNASAAGIQLTENFTHALSEAGFVTVSGLARGIDTACHLFSLQSGTIAILAGGVDQIYPPENKKLYQAIIEKGVLLSEAPLRHIARATDFPKRNRLIAACGMGLLVIEAAMRSGTLITARFAADIGRLVFAIPGSPLDNRSIGTNQLIKDGCIMATSPNDLITALKPLYVDPMCSLPKQAPICMERLVETKDRQLSFQLNKIDAETRNIHSHHMETMAGVVSEAHPTNLSEKIISYLNTTPVQIEKLCDYTNASLPDVHLVITKLELKGQIYRHLGGLVSLVPSKIKR